MSKRERFILLAHSGLAVTEEIAEELFRTCCEIYEKKITYFTFFSGEGFSGRVKTNLEHKMSETFSGIEFETTIEHEQGFIHAKVLVEEHILDPNHHETDYFIEIVDPYDEMEKILSEKATIH